MALLTSTRLTVFSLSHCVPNVTCNWLTATALNTVHCFRTPLFPHARRLRLRPNGGGLTPGLQPPQGALR